MHDHLGSNIQNPSQKFSKNSIDFEKSHNFPKPPQKLGHKMWNAW